MLLTHSWPPPFLLLFGVLGRFLAYLMMSSVVAKGNVPKPTRTGNLQLSVTFGENLRSIDVRCALRLRLYLWRNKKNLCWKLGRGINFGSNGLIYTFNSIFSYLVFFCSLLVFLNIFLKISQLFCPRPIFYDF